jgi:hypothetical protein
MGSLSAMSATFYRLLGLVVWKGAKLFLRRRYGPTYVPRPVLAGAVVAVLGGIAALVLTRRETG